MATRATPQSAARRPAAKIEPMPAAGTRAESLRLKLEEEILNRRLPPGLKLDEEEIARRFGLSRTPVREALKGLTSSGLVEIRPHQGAYVATLTLRTIIEMVELMTVLEASCAGLAARRHEIADQSRIKSAQALCESRRCLSDPGAFYDANVAFHEAIYRASHNEFLSAQTRALHQRLEPYRRLVAYRPGAIARANAEHREIAEAIFTADGRRAEEVMRGHLRTLQDSIVSMVDALATSPPARKRAG